ncbi:MAG: radical SAM family heme chaperone HemW [Bacteroidota bacterium]|nr:radical SAM family heme chaperone HemW [Bacteroidota bacterium]
MAGIYIHIPFCRQRCYYCDFHSSTFLKNLPELLYAIKKEIAIEKDYFENELIETVYFGGGTPSILKASEIQDIINSILLYHEISPYAEITFECNPDDLSTDYIHQLKNTDVNRLSIGIQSFDDKQLQAMNRRHSSSQAIGAVKKCQVGGFDNISVDLIYGLPGMQQDEWQRNIQKALDLNIQHISAYHLTFEQGTVFFNHLKKGRLKEIDDEISNQQYKTLIDITGKAGFEHYEISNFALPGLYSKHNSNYWKREKYLGVGPASHSFNLKTRHWNVSHNKKYIEGIMMGHPNREIETIDKVSQFNEFIMTSLRTMWGVNIEYCQNEFGEKQTIRFKKIFQNYIKQGNAYRDGNFYKLTQKGLFISDKIISELFE